MLTKHPLNILLFSPFASVWSNKTIDIALAKSLKSLGHVVIEVNCDRAFVPSCPAFAEAGLDDTDATAKEREKVCSICSMRSNVASSLSRTRSITLVATHENNIQPRPVLVDSTIDATHWSMDHKESLYDFMVNSKATSLVFEAKSEPVLRSYAANWEFTKREIKRIILQEGIDLVITGDPHSSANSAAWAAARETTARTVTVGSALNHLQMGNAFSMFDSVERQAAVAWSNEWQIASNRPLSRKSVRNISRSVAFTLSAQSPFTYSTRFKKASRSSVFAALGLYDSKPLVLVVTTTNDERFAAKAVGKMPVFSGVRNFESQLDFLHKVLHLAGKRPEINFVIRLHPRLIANKRDSKLSPYFRTLEEALRDKSSNVYVNWPNQNIALADLALASDCALNWTSTAGLDILSLGTPVVSCEPIETFSYPPSLGFVLKRPDDMSAMIDTAIAKGRSTDFAVSAFRYKHFLSESLTLKISSLARKRRKVTLFRILNWARVRKSIFLPRALAWSLDFLDGLPFRIKASELDRLNSFLDDGLPQLPPADSLPVSNNSVLLEKKWIEVALGRLAGVSFKQ